MWKLHPPFWIHDNCTFQHTKNCLCFTCWNEVGGVKTHTRHSTKICYYIKDGCRCSLFLGKVTFTTKTVINIALYLNMYTGRHREESIFFLKKCQHLWKETYPVPFQGSVLQFKSFLIHISRVIFNPKSIIYEVF